MSTRGIVVKGPHAGACLRDDRHGSIWELLATSSAPAPLGVAWAEVDPGATSPLHLHERTYEGYFISSGTGTVLIGDEIVEVGPGDAISIPPGTPHAITASAAGLAFIVFTHPPYDPDDDHEIAAGDIGGAR